MHEFKSIFDKRRLPILVLLFLGFYQPAIGTIRSTYYIPVLALALILIKRIPVLEILKTRAGDVGKGLLIIELYMAVFFSVNGGERSYLVYPVHLAFGMLYIFAIRRFAKMEEISDSAFESLILCTGWVQSTLCVIMCIFPFVKAAHWRYLLHVMTNAAERQRMVELGIFRFYGIAGPNQYLSSIGTVSALLFLLALHRMIRVKAFRAIELFKTVFLLVPAFLDGRLGMILALLGATVQFFVYYVLERKHLKLYRIFGQLLIVVCCILACGLMVQKASFLHTVPAGITEEAIAAEKRTEESLAVEETAGISDSSIIAEERVGASDEICVVEDSGVDDERTATETESSTTGVEADDNSVEALDQVVIQPNDPTQNEDESIRYTANNWSTVVVDFLVAIVTRDTDSKVYEWYGGLLPSNWNVPKGIHFIIGDGTIPDKVIEQGDLIGRSDSGFARLLCVGGLILLVLELSLFFHVLRVKKRSLYPIVFAMAACFLLAELKGNPYIQIPVVMIFVLIVEQFDSSI